MKYCENGHSNRDDANFCALCGKPILQNDSDFTYDKYPNIKFRVTEFRSALKNTDYDNIKFLLYAGPLFAALLYVAISFIAEILDVAIDTDFMDILQAPGFLVIILICVVVGEIPSIVMLLLILIRYLRLKANSDFVEITDGSFTRIAKNSKLGLLEKGDCYRVRLPARYDIIEEISDGCFSIQKNGKHGIYSTVFRKIIVPPKYESISLRSEGVWCAMDKGNVVYYSCNGKVVR